MKQGVKKGVKQGVHQRVKLGVKTGSESVSEAGLSVTGRVGQKCDTGSDAAQADNSLQCAVHSTYTEGRNQYTVYNFTSVKIMYIVNCTLYIVQYSVFRNPH